MIDAVADPWTVDLAPHEAGLLELLEVLRDGRLGERKLVHDLPADARVATQQQPNDRDASGMAESFGEPRELLVGGSLVGDDDQIAILGTFSNAGRRSMRLAKRTPEDETMWTQTFTGGTGVNSDGWAVAVDPFDYLLFVGCRFGEESGSGVATIAKISP